MTKEREAAEIVRSWMKEETRLDDSGLHRVLARLPDTPQRSHRWLWPLDSRPFGSGATRSADPTEASPTWRFTSMFTPIRVAATTAVLALTGTLALISGPLAPSGPAAAPGAESSVSMEPAYYTGTVIAWEAGRTEVTSLPDRTIEQWPTEFRNDVTDPRLAGTGTAMDYLETITGPDGAPFVTHSGVGRLINDGGSFALECTGGGIMEAGSGIITCWYEGEDGYEGLTAFEVMTLNRSGNFDVQGWVFPADRPPLLEYTPE